MRTTIIAVLSLMLIVLGASYYAAAAAPVVTVGANPPVGSSCIVQFRRDLLGCAANLPVSPTTDNINGAEVSVSGKLLKIDTEWVVLEQKNSLLWIPRQNVLLLKIEKPGTSLQ